jgi:plastocyanin
VRDTDEKFSYNFGKAGTYNYFCSIHPKMTGKIVVQ